MSSLQSNQLIKITQITYAFVFVLSSYLYWARNGPYLRPTSYFVLLALLAGVSFIQIITIGNDTAAYWRAVIFINILLISLSFILTQQALYQTVLSRDPWGHMVLTEQILTNGHIPTQTEAWAYPVYTKIPGFHLANAFIMDCVGVNYKWASVLLGSAILILEMLTGYLIARFIFQNEKLALMSVLFIGISDNVLDMAGKNIVPNSMGVGIVFLVFYLLIRKFSKNASLNLRILSLFFVLLISLSITHSVSYGFLLIHLTIFLFLSLFSKYQFKGIAMLSATALVVAFFEWGLRDTYYLLQLTLLLKWLFLGLGVEHYERNVSLIPFTYLILARIGMIIYFAIAGVMVLKSLLGSIKDYSGARFNFIVHSGVFVGIAPIITFFWAGIAHRFWYYGEMLGSVFVAKFTLEHSRRWITKVFVLLFVVTLSFLMFVASVSNDDNPLVPQYTLRTGWYDSEISSAEFILENLNMPLASDLDFASHLKCLKTCLMKSCKIDMSFPRTFDDALERNDILFALRSKLVESRYFVLGGRWSQNPHMPLKENIKKIVKEFSIYKNVVYNNRNVFIVL